MGAIINIFKRIIGLITGLFSQKADAGQKITAKKGKDGFYMEAGPADDSAAVPVAVAVPAAVKSAPAAAATPAKPGGVPKGKAGKAAAAAAIATVATVTAAPKPVDAVDLIRAALAATQSSPVVQQAQAEATASFAEMNAVPITLGGRRRPGANMTGFLDLAKTMKSR
jgi:hypothetical protein